VLAKTIPIPPYGAAKKSTWCYVPGHNFAVPGTLPQKFQKNCLGYSDASCQISCRSVKSQRRTVTKQKKRKTKLRNN